MLKPFKDRVRSTYALMVTMIEQASLHGAEVLEKRKQDFASDGQSTRLGLDWKVDTTRWDMLSFKGYTADQKPSAVTGMMIRNIECCRSRATSVKCSSYSFSDWPRSAALCFIICAAVSPTDST